VWARAQETRLPFALVEGDDVSQRGGRLAGAAGAIQHGAQVHERVAALADVVGALGESHRVARGGLRALERAADCEGVSAGDRLPDLPRAHVGGGPRRGEVGVTDGLLAASPPNERGRSEARRRSSQCSWRPTP
jgi:hypothetical protein